MGSYCIILACQALKWPTGGVLLCRYTCQVLDGPASLLFSCLCWRVEREAVVMAPPTTCESTVSPYFYGCLAFLHRHFPPQSPPSHPLDLCLCSQQQFSPGDCSTFPKLQLQLLRLPGDLRPCLGVCMYSCGKDSLILIPFRLPQISCSRSALNVSTLT